MLIKLKFRFPEIVFGILFAVAIFAMGMLFSSQPSKENQQQNQTTEAAQHKPANVSAEERLANYTYWLTWLNGILAVSTVGLWGVTYITLRHGRKTAERELRAYMGIANGGTRFEPSADGGDLPGGRVQIMTVNYGRTPAHHATLWARELDRPPQTFDYTGGEFIIRNQIVQPQQRFGRVAGVRTAQSAPFFIYGYVEYTDIFEHRWRYLFAYNFNSAWGGDRFQAHIEHNEEEDLGPEPESA